MRFAQCPAEDYFRAAIKIAGTTATIVSGTPSEQVRQLLNGEIDAFWQDGSVPSPSLVAVANAAECVVFGLSPIEIAALSKRFTFMTSASIRRAPILVRRARSTPLPRGIPQLLTKTSTRASPTASPNVSCRSRIWHRPWELRRGRRWPQTPRRIPWRRITSVRVAR